MSAAPDGTHDAATLIAEALGRLEAKIDRHAARPVSIDADALAILLVELNDEARDKSGHSLAGARAAVEAAGTRLAEEAGRLDQAIRDERSAFTKLCGAQLAEDRRLRARLHRDRFLITGGTLAALMWIWIGVNAIAHTPAGCAFLAGDWKTSPKGTWAACGFFTPQGR